MVEKHEQEPIMENPIVQVAIKHGLIGSTAIGNYLREVAKNEQATITEGEENND